MSHFAVVLIFFSRICSLFSISHASWLELTLQLMAIVYYAEPVYFFFEDSNINRNITMNMGATKTTEFTAKDNRLAKYAKAMAHPARVAILKFLATKKTCQCGDIVEEIPLSQSTVSQHLRELKDAGLIKGEIEGARVCYCIDEKEWKAAQVWINQLFDSFKGCGDNSC